MKYERFEDLPVWQVAADLAAKMFEWSQQSAFRTKGDLANQLQRATLSISNNIAEGFERSVAGEMRIAKTSRRCRCETSQLAIQFRGAIEIAGCFETRSRQRSAIRLNRLDSN